MFASTYSNYCSAHGITPLPVHAPPALVLPEFSNTTQPGSTSPPLRPRHVYAPCLHLTRCELASLALPPGSTDDVGTSGLFGTPLGILPAADTPPTSPTAAAAASPVAGTSASSPTSPVTGALRSLQARHVRLPAHSLSAIGAALPHEPSVVELRLLGCALSLADVQSLASLLPTTGVRVLFLDHNPVDGPADTVASAWSALIHPDTSLLGLVSLRGNALGDAAASALAANLRANRALKTLHLARNRIARAGAEALAEALVRNTALVALSLAGNLLTDEAAGAIARALSRQPLANDEAAVRRKYYAELERIKVAEEESLLLQEQTAKKKTGKPGTARGGSAEDKAGKGKAGAAAAGGAAGSGAAAGKAGAGAAGKGASSAKSATGNTSNPDLSSGSTAFATGGGSGAGAGAGGKKKPSAPATPGSGAAASAAGGKKQAGGKRGAAAAAEELMVPDETPEEVVEAIAVPPGIDLDMFEAGGAFFAWGNRTLTHLNLSHNKLSASVCKLFADAILDQVPADKHMVTTNAYGDAALRDRPRHGLLRLLLEGNLFPMAEPAVADLDAAVNRKLAMVAANVVASSSPTPVSVARAPSARK
ncbi:hypothetical protein H9P43_005819 [Blastocladiella emersonii ATCC 22665]|nr:hypothetical protein H9P43_005819 [Blastocladiella emersonii ATCC 22665]